MGRLPVKKHQDAFGQALLAYSDGWEDCLEIVERDDGFIDAGAISRYFTTFEEWHSTHKKAMKFARGRVLDVGCGAGRHCLYLQQRGWDVVGIDASPLAIEVCRRSGVETATAMHFTQVSRRIGRFDTIVMMGNNFGAFANPKRAKWLLKRLYGMTSQDVRIIAEGLDPYRTGNAIHRKYHRLNRARGRMPGQVRIRIRFRNLRTNWFDYLFVSQWEMTDLLRGTGWSVREFIDSGGSTYVSVIGKRTNP